MTTQYADLSTVSGQTLTANLFAVDGDTILYTADAVTERTNAKGVYRCTFGEASAISGTYRMILFSGSTPFAEGIRVFSGTDTEVASARTENLSTRLPAALVSGRIDANTGSISGDATAADNLEAMLDGTGGVTITAGLTGNVTGNLSGSVGSVTSGVTVTTNNDKTGYSLTATTGLGNQTANITGNLSGSVGSVTGAVGSVTSGVTVSTNNDKTGYSLTATTGLGNQTANITGNLSGSVGSVTGNVGGIAGTTTTFDALQTALNSAHGSGSWATATGFSTHSASDVWAVGTRTITGGSLTTAPPTAGAIADAVWDEARTGHTTNGTFGYYVDAQISSAGSNTLTLDASGAQLVVNAMLAQGPTLYNTLATSESTLRIGDEYVQEFTGLGDLTARANIAFVLKTKKSDADSASLIYLTETGGLTRVNGAVYGTTGNGSITIDDANTGDITVRISSAVTGSLTVGKRQDAVKILIASGNDTTPRQGITNVIDGTVDAVG